MAEHNFAPFLATDTRMGEMQENSTCELHAVNFAVQRTPFRIQTTAPNSGKPAICSRTFRNFLIQPKLYTLNVSGVRLCKTLQHNHLVQYLQPVSKVIIIIIIIILHPKTAENLTKVYTTIVNHHHGHSAQPETQTNPTPNLSRLYTICFCIPD